jgi:hypothetical protein
MNRVLVVLLRLLLVIVFVVCLAVQVMAIPVIAGQAASRYPGYAHLAATYTVLWISVVACAQVALVCIWMLLGTVRRGVIFSPRAFVWVNGIIGAGVLATALAIGQAVLMFVSNSGPVWLLLAIVAVVGAALTLVVVVMRSLLLLATALQIELDEVV